ncbi:MAG: hypothetical protein MUC38_09340 [Cyclobacteriaceae bacterium]|jgi:hypothetical protein|nr:hypothetical protein [Cyclobacteriaceae bacterium]
MTTTRKIVLGVGLAGGALLATWLLTGDRKKKTTALLTRGAQSLQKTLKKETSSDESEPLYV